MKKKSISIGLLVFCFTLLLTCSAYAFTSLVAYGDSLSDTGNVARITDGDLWVENLASATGSALHNAAYAGATTGMDNPAAGSTILGLQWQVETFQGGFSSTLDMNDTLFTVWAGANDFFQTRGYENAVQNIGTAIQALANSGAQNILVPNLPNLGDTPRFYNTALAATATGWTMGFNFDLSAELAGLQQSNPDVTLYFLDTFALFDSLIERDAAGVITNHDDLFFDGVHPNHVGHAAIAAEAYRLVNPIPLPGAIYLLASGMVGFGAVRRRMR